MGRVCAPDSLIKPAQSMTVARARKVMFLGIALLTLKAIPSKPRVGPIVAVLLSEPLFEDARFGAGTKPLDGNDDGEKYQRAERMVQVEQEAGDGGRAEDIDGIADLGVDAGGDELARLRRDGKIGAELDSRDGEQHEKDSGDGEADL